MLSFWSKVEKTETCWIWTGAKTGRGYGNFRGRAAHRLVYEFLVGPIPAGLQIDHLCRVRHCVNPDHLEPVTQQENIRRGGFAQRTHCPRGHEYTSENTIRRPNGWRQCRACTQAYDRLRRPRGVPRKKALA